MPSAATVAELQVVINADTSGAEKALKDVGGKVEGFGKSMSSVLGGIGTGIGFKAFDLIVDGIKTATDVAVGFNSEMEQSTIAFTSMLGSAEKAQAFLDDMKQFAATTPFEFPDLLRASKQMLAFGFAASDVRPLLTAVGSAAAAMGTGREGVDAITTALGQMKAATVVQAGELNQLTEQGVPAFQILADAMHISTGEVKKLASSGKIASDVFITAFQNWAKNNYGDMMAKQALTFQGAISTIKDSLTFAVANAFKPFFALLSEGAIALAGFVQSAAFTEWADDVAVAIQDTIDALKAFGQYIGVVLDDGDTMNDWLTHMPEPLAAVAFAIGTVTVAITNGLSPALTWLTETGWPALKAVMQSVVTWWATVWMPTVALVVTWLTDKVGVALTWLTTTGWPLLLGAMQAVSTWLWDVLVPTAQQVVWWFSDKIGATLTWLTTTAWPVLQAAMVVVGGWIMTTLVPTLTAAWSWLTEKVGAGLTWLTETAWPKLGEAANKVQNWIKETLIPTLMDWYSWLDQKLGPIYTWFTTVGWPLLQKAGEAVWTWLTGPFFTALSEWYDWFQVRLSPIYTWFTTAGWPKLQEAGEAVWTWLTGPFFTALSEWYEWLQDRLSPIFAWFTTTGWPDFQAAGATVWTWLTGSLIPALKEWFSWLGEKTKTAAEWSIAPGFPKLQAGFKDLHPEIVQGTKDWEAFTTALAKTDAGESWVAILANLSAFGKYLIDNIKLGDWFRDITNGAAAASGWADYIAEAVAWILRTIRRWSDAFPGQRELPDVDEPPKPPSGNAGGGGGGGGGAVPAPPDFTAPPDLSPTPSPSPAPAPAPSPAPSPAPPPGGGDGGVTPGGPNIGTERRGGGMEVENYIRSVASNLGIDPSIAVAVANTEGGARDYMRIGDFRGPPWYSGVSYWPFQLHYGGAGTPYAAWGKSAGMGNDFTRDKGIQPGDWRGWMQSTNWALGIAKQDGWRQWYGAAEAGIGRWDGIPGHAAGGWAGLHGPELAWLGERGPEYVVSNAALRGGGSAGAMQSVTMPIVIGNRVIEELWITGRDLAIRRGRVPGAGAASMGSLA